MLGRIILWDHGARGLAHQLDGRPIEVGAVVELSLSGGRWLRCQYRWNGDPETQPVFSVVLGGDWERRAMGDPRLFREPPEAVLRVELEDGRFRWPTSEA